MTESTYKIRGTKVTSPYPVQLTPAEIRLVFSLQKIFSPNNIFADCYFASPTRSTDQIQIDCIAINQQGIFVFESKDYVGWIFGNGRQRYWTQISSYGQEKHRFYNPILQNANHIRAIQAAFPSDTPIYSIIVFGSSATLKQITAIPDRCHVCTHSQVLSIISQIKSPRLLQEVEVKSLCTNLIKSRTIPNTITRNEHIQDVQDISAQSPLKN